MLVVGRPRGLDFFIMSHERMGLTDSGCDCDDDTNNYSSNKDDIVIHHAWVHYPVRHCLQRKADGRAWGWCLVGTVGFPRHQ